MYHRRVQRDPTGDTAWSRGEDFVGLLHGAPETMGAPDGGTLREERFLKPS